MQPVLDEIVESAARVCGVDDVFCDSARATLGFAGSFWSYSHGRVGVSINEPQYRWMREHGALHIPDVRAQNEFPAMGSLGDFRTFLALLRQQGELIGALIARRTECVLYPDADQASRNLRRPGGDRHRKRAIVHRTQRKALGASDCHGRGARHHQPLADRRAAGARCHRRERGEGLWC